MADSSTSATPSTTSPSAGMGIACLDEHDLACPQRVAGDRFVHPCQI
jgi:hypothetical protein